MLCTTGQAGDEALAKLEDMRKEIEMKIEQKMQLDQMEEEMKQKQEQVNEKEKIVEKLQNVIKEKDSELKNRLIELEEMKNMVATEKDNSSKLKREIESIRRDSNESRNKLEQVEKTLTEELAEKESELRDVWGKWRKEKDEKERLRKEIEEQDKTGELNVEKLKKLEQKYGQAKEDRSSLKEKVTELEEDIDSIKQEREQERVTYEKTCLDKEQQITDKILELEKSQKLVNELEQKIENMVRERKGVEQLKAKSHSDTSEEAQKLEKLKRQIEESLVIEKLIYLNKKVQGEESGEEEEDSDNSDKEDEDVSLKRAQQLVHFIVRKVNK